MQLAMVSHSQFFLCLFIQRWIGVAQYTLHVRHARFPGNSAVSSYILPRRPRVKSARATLTAKR